jgi:hypothetical protein
LSVSKGEFKQARFDVAIEDSRNERLDIGIPRKISGMNAMSVAQGRVGRFEREEMKVGTVRTGREKSK